jgi:SAM-dependent methyltransferase
MHGETIDWVVVNTVLGGMDYPTGECHNGNAVKEYLQYEFENDFLKEQPIYKKVLDIGSLDINGTIRNYSFLREDKLPQWREIIGCEEYIGIDLIDGPSVDVVMNSNNITFPENSFDLVISISQLEHDKNPVETLKGAYNVLKQGGTFLLACPTDEIDEHKFLGGGNTETHNVITRELLENWLKEAGFIKIRKFITTHIDHLVNATK